MSSRPAASPSATGPRTRDCGSASRAARPSTRFRARSWLLRGMLRPRLDFDDHDAQLLVSNVPEPVRSPRTVEDDVPGADLELLAVERHQPFPGDDDVELLVVGFVGVTADVRPGTEHREIDEPQRASIAGHHPREGDLALSAMR